MKRETYDSHKKSILNFDTLYVKSISLDKLKWNDESQQRASGHRYDGIEKLISEIEVDGQQVPIDVTTCSDGGYTPQDGWTRFEAIKRINKKRTEAGEKELEILVTDYVEKTKSYDQNDWADYRFEQNEHEYSAANTKKDFEKLIGMKQKSGAWTKEVGFTFQSDPEKYGEDLIEIVKKKYPRWSNNAKTVVKNILSDPDMFPNFWSYDAASSTEKMRKCTNLEWDETKSGKTDEGTGHACWACGSNSQISKDQLAYVFKRRTQEPKTTTTLIMYVGSAALAGKGEAHVWKTREGYLREVNKWNNPSKGLIATPLWDKVGFLPQIKRTEVENEVIWAEKNSNGDFEIKK